jgi:hypothetical protein
VNVALGKKASQISTATYNPPIGYAAASRAVDGNTSSYLTQGSVAVTEIGQNPWWKVDLDGDYDVSRVVVYNRQDSCDVCLLKDFVVSLKNNTGFSLSSTERTSFRFLNRSVRVFDWWPPRHHVRYVTISSTAFTSIGLAEVQVYSAFINNIAFNKTVILSPVPSNQSAAGVGAWAVDNRTDTAARTSDGNSSHWVEVRLEGTYNISRVSVNIDAALASPSPVYSITLYCNSTLTETFSSERDWSNWVVEPEGSSCTAVRITGGLSNPFLAVYEVNVFPG